MDPDNGTGEPHHLHRLDRLATGSTDNDVLAVTFGGGHLDGAASLTEDAVGDGGTDEETVLTLRQRERYWANGRTLFVRWNCGAAVQRSAAVSGGDGHAGIGKEKRTSQDSVPSQKMKRSSRDTHQLGKFCFDLADNPLDQVLVSRYRDSLVAVAVQGRGLTARRLLATLLDHVDSTPADIPPRDVDPDRSRRLLVAVESLLTVGGVDSSALEDLRNARVQQGPHLARDVGEARRRLCGPLADDREDLGACRLDGGLRARERDRDERAERVVVVVRRELVGSICLAARRIFEVFVPRDLDVRSGRVRDALQGATWEKVVRVSLRSA